MNQQALEKTYGKKRLSRVVMSPLNRLVEKYIPSTLAIAIILTLLVMVMAWLLTDSTPVIIVQSWGDGLSGLLAFMTQVSLGLFLGYMLAHTRPVDKLLSRVANIPKTALSAYLFVFLVAALSSLILWALGLILGGLIARKVAVEAARRSLKVDFGMLVASGFAGFIVQQMGYTAVGPVTAATPDSFLAEYLDGPLSLNETIFSPWNIIGTVLIIVIVGITLAVIAPKEPNFVFSAPSEEAPADSTGAATVTVAERVDTNRILTIVIGLLLMVYVAIYFTRGGELNLDIINWAFLGLILLTVSGCGELLELAKDAAGNVGPILVQFPLYAAIMGIMSESGLVEIIAGWFISASNSTTFPLFALLAAGALNMFIPSGGGQFAVQGPIMLSAGNDLGVDPALTVMAVTYGDQWTNMIQPFWAIPLLAIAGLKIKDILGYTSMVCLTSGFGFAAILLGATILMGS